MRPIRADLEELVPFIRAVIAVIRRADVPEESTPPDRGVLPPQPYRDTDIQRPPERLFEPARVVCWCGLVNCHLPLPHRRSE